MTQMPQNNAPTGGSLAAIAEMAALFLMFCGFFLMLGAAYFYVDVMRGMRGAVLPVITDIAGVWTAASRGGLTDEDRAEFEDIGQEHARLQEDLREAITDGDKDAAEYIRQEQNDLAARERELVDNIQSRGDAPDEATPDETDIPEELTENLRERSEIGKLLSIIGGPMLLVGCIAYPIARAVRKSKS